MPAAYLSTESCPFIFHQKAHNTSVQPVHEFERFRGKSSSPLALEHLTLN
jgi:hypothetical protein